MKPSTKTTLALLAGVAFALQLDGALAQATGAAEKNGKTADFAAREKAMQDASRSSASGPVAAPTTPAVRLNQNKDAGKGAFEAEMMLQANKPSRKVDKNAKASDPIKSISKMTPQERAELRKEVVKDAKP